MGGRVVAPPTTSARRSSEPADGESSGEGARNASRLHRSCDPKITQANRRTLCANRHRAARREPSAPIRRRSKSASTVHLGIVRRSLRVSGSPGHRQQTTRVMETQDDARSAGERASITRRTTGHGGSRRVAQMNTFYTKYFHRAGSRAVDRAGCESPENVRVADRSMRL